MASLSLLFLTLLLFTITFSDAKEFPVGGSTGAWEVPATTTDTLNKWAEANRFQVGDTLVWNYDGSKDSVLQVTRDAYISCSISSPVAEHKDGSTKVKLLQRGAYYFISGAKGACDEGEKLIVVVMAIRGGTKGFRFAPAPSPSPVGYSGPAVGPTSGAPALFGWGVVEGLVVLGMLGMVM